MRDVGHLERLIAREIAAGREAGDGRFNDGRAGSDEESLGDDSPPVDIELTLADESRRAAIKRK